MGASHQKVGQFKKILSGTTPRLNQKVRIEKLKQTANIKFP
jgi:hypothetical protein